METTLLALLIFGLRILDVSIGTVRIVVLVRGRRFLAGGLGFVESLVWVTAAGLVLTNLDSPIKAVAFASGYAAGTILGSTIERWIGVGDAMVRVITGVDSPPVADHLRAEGYAVTVINGEGLNGDVRIAFTVIGRRRARRVLEVVRNANPEAFVTIEDTSMPSMHARRSLLRK
jgi:uncharacterized protein YebE (UPF0316 family)